MLGPERAPSTSLRPHDAWPIPETPTLASDFEYASRQPHCTPGPAAALIVTRRDAYALADAIVAAGYSVAIAIGVQRNMSPREHVTVSVAAIRLKGHELRALMDLAASAGVEMHVTAGGGVEFVDPPGRPTT